MCLSIPQRLHTNSKPILDKIQEGQMLYRRYKQNTVNPVVENLHEVFPLRKDSYNLGSLSNPSDVLYNIKRGDHHLNNGILSLRLNNILSLSFDHPSVDNRKYSIVVKHDPRHCMYPHCELIIIQHDREEGQVPIQKQVDHIESKEAKSFFRKEFLSIAQNPLKHFGAISSLELEEHGCNYYES